MAEAVVQVAPDSTGAKLRTRSRVVGANTVHEQYVIPQEEAVFSYKGRAGTFRLVGRATATQNLFTIWNGSTNANLIVRVNRILLDTYTTAAKLLATAPPIVRVSRITAAPTSGDLMIKSTRDTTAGTTDANVVLRQDSASDTTVSTTTLAAAPTAGNMLTQEVLPRVVTPNATTTASVNPYFEPADRMEFFAGEPDIILRQNQGLVVHIAVNANAATDFYFGAIDWDEYTLP